MSSPASGKPQRHKSSLRGVDVSDAEGASARLSEELAKQSVRVIDLFRDWDEDGNGVVTRREFARAMPLIGLHASKAEVFALFDSWDVDGTGSINLYAASPAPH